jgi:isochorismate synthase
VSIFYYRIPRKEIVEMQGDWTVSGNEPTCKYWISDFESKRFYSFEPNTSEEKTYQNLSFSKKAPHWISKEEYVKSAKKLIQVLKESEEVNKVILSRVDAFIFKTKNSVKLFHTLCAMYEDAFVYMVSSPLFGTWIGASPETLLKIENKKATTMALASTKSKTDDSIWGEKEQLEHQIVSDFIEDTLAKNEFVSNVLKDVRTEYIAGESKHLMTNFSFDLAENNFTNLALELHPTPAISGFPVVSAIKLIKKFEEHERHLYCGIVTVEGSASYVNLRCAQIQKDTIFLYLGGGFNALSIAEQEYDETHLKAKTIGNAIKELEKPKPKIVTAETTAIATEDEKKGKKTDEKIDEN